MLTNNINKSNKKYLKYRRKQRGQSMVEYALIVVFIGLASLASLTVLGGIINHQFCPFLIGGDQGSCVNGVAYYQSIVINVGGQGVIEAEPNEEIVQYYAAQDCSSNCPFGLGNLTAGNTYLVAGKLYMAGYNGDGQSANGAELNDPIGVELDQYNNLLINDYQNNVIRMVASYNCSSNCPYNLSSFQAGHIYTVVT